MESEYRIFFKHKHYSFSELMGQAMVVKEKYADVCVRHKKRGVDVFIKIRPTKESVQYKLKISAEVDSTKVSVFPVEPHIGSVESKMTVPHMYQSGALCLFFPDNNEWKYTDSWADTLVPWAGLWLYYYEIWLQTGEWLGGGVHERKRNNKGKTHISELLGGK